MEYPQRKRLRLESYDYSQPGYYFVTICTAIRRQDLLRLGLQGFDPLLQGGDLGIVLGQDGRFLLLQLSYGSIEFSDFFIHRSSSFLWSTARPLGFGLCHFRSPILC